MKNKRIIFAVYDDLFHEYRGYKTARSFQKSGYDVLMIGIRISDKKLKGWDDIPHQRIRLVRNFPLSLNMIIYWFKMFFLLLSSKSDIYYSHDIFPLLPVFLASKLKRVPYIYDAHEFWHGNSQVENRPLMKKFWTSYEGIFIRSAKSVITVSEPIAKELERIYGIKKVGVFTNLPLKKDIPHDRSKLHNLLSIGAEIKIVLYQGRFLFNNGLDTVIRSFSDVSDKAVLVLIGEGSEKNYLEEVVEKTGVSGRVFFAGPFPHGELLDYTVCADVGLCLIKNSGKSYFYSAPNKMFEYIQAQVPQITSNFPEMKKYIQSFGVGEVIDPEDQDMISDAINIMIDDEIRLNEMKSNCIEASKKLVWENIENELVNIAT